jgi:hypothetical protein
MNVLRNLIVLHELQNPSEHHFEYHYELQPGIHFCASRITGDPQMVKTHLINSSLRIAGNDLADAEGVELSSVPLLFRSGVNAILTIGGFFPFVVGALYHDNRRLDNPVWDSHGRWTFEFCSFLIDQGVNVGLVTDLAMAATKRQYDQPISTPNSDTPAKILQRVNDKVTAKRNQAKQLPFDVTVYYSGSPTAPILADPITAKIAAAKASPLHRAMGAKTQTIGLVVPGQR